MPCKKQTIFGYKLHLLIALNGAILDFELAPANEYDLEIGFELLSEHTYLQVLGDKAYISVAKVALLETVLNSKRSLVVISKNNYLVPHSGFSTLFGR